MPPQRRPDRSHARPARAFLFPQLLARSRYFGPNLGLVRSRPLAGLELPHRLVQQRLVHFGSEYIVREFNLADLLITPIHYVYRRHAATSWTSGPLHTRRSAPEPRLSPPARYPRCPPRSLPGSAPSRARDPCAPPCAYPAAPGTGSSMRRSNQAPGGTSIRALPRRRENGAASPDPQT